MNVVIGSVVVGLAMMSAQAFGQTAGLEPAGTWLTENGQAKIRVEHCGENNEKLCGFVAWLKDPLNEKGLPRTDIKNPDPAKRGRPSVGLELMTGLKPDDPTHFVGEIYNAENGKMYSVTVAIEKPSELEIKGCLLHFLCGSQTWVRVADVAPASLASTKVLSPSLTAKNGTKPMVKQLHDNQPAVK